MNKLLKKKIELLTITQASMLLGAVCVFLCNLLFIIFEILIYLLLNNFQLYLGNIIAFLIIIIIGLLISFPVGVIGGIIIGKILKWKSEKGILSRTQSIVIGVIVGGILGSLIIIIPYILVSKVRPDVLNYVFYTRLVVITFLAAASGGFTAKILFLKTITKRNLIISKTE